MAKKQGIALQSPQNQYTQTPIVLKSAHVGILQPKSNKGDHLESVTGYCWPQSHEIAIAVHATDFETIIVQQ